MALNQHQMSLQEISSFGQPLHVCRDRYGWFNATFFHVWACSQCYTYLFPSQAPPEGVVAVPAAHLFPNEMSIPAGTLLYPDMFRGSEVVTSGLCDSLGQENCQRLSSCCSAALNCCDPKVLMQTGAPYMFVSNSSTCPRTWDGFSCFPETPADRTAQAECPAYISSYPNIGKVQKVCTEKGLWSLDTVTGLEWTDYTVCAPLQGYSSIYHVSIACSSLSLTSLLPACAIFLTFKQLRKQHRIRIHVNLFFSFILTNCVWLTWDYVIFRDRMDNPREGTYMHQNVIGCRILYSLSRYTWTCNFLWMSLEGFHLYWLINHAFKAPKSISVYYFIGWLVPCLPIGLYTLVRISYLDTSCWVNHASHLEWIVYGPNLVCLVLNFAFLVNILRILLTQIQSHPNEPSNYRSNFIKLHPSAPISHEIDNEVFRVFLISLARRALKATFILVPLFGLQLFLIVYRPDEFMRYFPYEILAKVITNCQGAAVAIMFCFLNSEVHGQFRSHFGLTRTNNSFNDLHSYTVSSDVRRVSARTNGNRMEYITLKCPVVCSESQTGRGSSPKVNLTNLASTWQPSNRNGHGPVGQIV